MAARTKEHIQVGYFLSRFGKKKPPEAFKGRSWKDVYHLFFNRLGDGRSLSSFEHSLKNTRDGFDGYFNNGREGWKSQMFTLIWSSSNPFTFVFGASNGMLPLDNKKIFTRINSPRCFVISLANP